MTPNHELFERMGDISFRFFNSLAFKVEILWQNIQSLKFKTEAETETKTNHRYFVKWKILDFKD